MNYRSDKYGNCLSALGYGCMRFPKKAGRRNFHTAIDKKAKVYYTDIVN